MQPRLHGMEWPLFDLRLSIGDGALRPVTDADCLRSVRCSPTTTSRILRAVLTTVAVAQRRSDHEDRVRVVPSQPRRMLPRQNGGVRGVAISVGQSPHSHHGRFHRGTRSPWRARGD